MDDKGTLLERPRPTIFVGGGVPIHQIERQRKPTKPYSSLDYLASFSNSSRYSPPEQSTRIIYGQSPVTSGASSSSSSFRSGQMVTLPATRVIQSFSKSTKSPKIETLVHNLSITVQPSAKAGIELARSLSTEPPVKTSCLVLPVKHLCYSSLAADRIAGYELIKSIYLNQTSISSMEGGCLWEALRRADLESESHAQDVQMETLGVWISKSRSLWGVCGVVDQLLAWCSNVLRSPNTGAKMFTTLHHSLQTIIESKAYVTEAQMVKLLQVHRIAVERTIEESCATPLVVQTCPTPLSMPTDIDEANGGQILAAHISLEDISLKLFGLLESIHKYELIPSVAIPSVMASLCQMIGHPPIDRDTDHLANSAIRVARMILVDKAYGSLAMEALEGFWDPIGDKSNHEIALGALRVAKRVILDCKSRASEPMNDPSQYHFYTSVEVDRMMQALRRLPNIWMVRSGGDRILVELVDLVEQVMTQFQYERTSEISPFVGKVILGLTGGLDLYWHNRGDTYKLSILEHNAAPTSVIAALERLLRAAQKDVVIQPPLDEILLSRTHHLTDEFLRGLIVRLQESRQLGPSGAAWNWKQNIRTLLGHFMSDYEGYPRARRVFAQHLSTLYISDEHLETFHVEIATDIITTLENLLPNEVDEVVIKAAFDICLKELVLSHEQETITKRIRTIWMNLALEDHHSSFRRVLAVKFFILGFNRFAFRPPQSLKVVEDHKDWKQSASAANTAIYLYRDIVALAGLSSHEGVIQGPLLHCPEARLVILQWLLRLRAGANHRIFAVDGPLTEVIPLATLADRVQGKKEESIQESIQVELESEFKPDPIATAWHRMRQWAAGSVRSRTGSAASRPSDGQPMSPVGPDSEMSTKFIGPLPRPKLWSLPDRVRRDLFVRTSIPSPAMTTFQTNRQDGYWLRVSIYVNTLVEILEHDDCWDVISYILCHLPLQLANKHFFCGSKVNATIRRLTIAICNAIKGNRLYKRLSSIGPMDISQDHVQAMLYHTLMVLIAYRNRFRLNADVLDLKARAIIDSIIEAFTQGLGSSIVTSRLCIEGLSLIVYGMPDELAKFATVIVEGLARVMTNPDMAIHIVEFLLVLGLSPKTYLGAFRPEDYRVVFAVALMYIGQHHRSDRPTLQTTNGKTSFSLAQHVLRTAFLVIHTWFMRIKPEERAQYIPFISQRLVKIHEDTQAFSPMTMASLDSLSRYAYGNADPKVTPSFMYKSIICPMVPEDWQNLRKPWRERHALERSNVADIQAWKLGNSIVTVSVMKQPRGWVRLTSRRPSCYIDILCHVEGDQSFVTARQDVMQALEVDKDLVVTPFSNSKEIDEPDPISGISWSSKEESPLLPEYYINPAILAPLLTSYPNEPSRRLQKFPDFNQLVTTLELIDSCPVIDTHKVGVIYVAPGQFTELEILANRHGSPAYAQFIKDLGRVVKIREELEVYTGGLQADKHGDYALAWWDDIGQILFHVATFMPNLEMPGQSSVYHKKAEIGNIHVKIVWNDSGKPFERETIEGAFNHINVVIEPHTLTPLAAYQTDYHTSGFFKVLLQVDPSLPRITSIGEFKLVSIEDLAQTVRNYALIACLFTTSWLDTGEDGPVTTPINTNWQERLKLINRSERLLSKEPEMDYSLYGLPVSAASVP